MLDVSPRSSVESRDNQNGDDDTCLTCRRIIRFVAVGGLHSLLVLTTREGQTDWVGLNGVAESLLQLGSMSRPAGAVYRQHPIYCL